MWEIGTPLMPQPAVTPSTQPYGENRDKPVALTDLKDHEATSLRWFDRPLSRLFESPSWPRHLLFQSRTLALGECGPVGHGYGWGRCADMRIRRAWAARVGGA